MRQIALNSRCYAASASALNVNCLFTRVGIAMDDIEELRIAIWRHISLNVVTKLSECHLS